MPVFTGMTVDGYHPSLTLSRQGGGSGAQQQDGGAKIGYRGRNEERWPTQMRVPEFQGVVLADDADDLLQPVAGVLAISRMLIALADAGVREAVVVPALAPDAAARLEREVARAGRRISIARALRADRPDGICLVLGSGAIPSASLLRRLARRPAPTVAVDALGTPQLAILKARDLHRFHDPPAAHRAALEDPAELIPLSDPHAADRAVLAETTKATDGIVSRLFNRPVSQRLSALFVRLAWIRPAHLTVATALIAPVMFACLAFGGAAGLAAGCLLFHAASVADGLDGEVARATFRTTARGAKLDTAVDMATNLLFLLGLSVGLLQGSDALHGYVGLAGFGAFLCGALALALLIRIGPGGGSFDVLTIAYSRKFADHRTARALGGVFGCVMKRDFFALLFAVLGVVGLAWLIPWLVAAMAGPWLVVIALCAGVILRRDSAELLPDHIRPVFRPPAE